MRDPILAKKCVFGPKTPKDRFFGRSETTSTRWESSNFGCFVKIGRVTAAEGRFCGILAEFSAPDRQIWGIGVPIRECMMRDTPLGPAWGAGPHFYRCQPALGVIWSNFLTHIWGSKRDLGGEMAKKRDLGGVYPICTPYFGYNPRR